jgi:glycosyltransferase involved in cell wall biosynthesis
MIKISDKIIVVSEKLIKHKSGKYRLKSIMDKTMIIYGAADSNHFYYSEEIRKRKREEWGIINKIVLVYVGMLDKVWQIPDKIFQFAADLKRSIPDLFFMIITPNIKIAEILCRKYGLSKNDTMIEEATQDNLKEYLNASDFGLLLRENTLVNNVASPTKFAEYLLCGLPVIISEGIGDYSEFTINKNVGIVIRNNDINFERIVSIISKESIFNRSEIYKTGIQNLSKQIFIDSLIKSYNQL